MPKPLWKFLEDGGISACIEYGEIPSIKGNANCCSWATGDLLHYKFYESCLVGQGNGFTNMNEKVDGDSYFKFMQKYFTRSMLNNGAIFLGLGNKIPKVNSNFYIVAVFEKDPFLVMHPDYHFIRQHKNNKWSHRKSQTELVTELFTDNSTNTIFDFLNLLGNYSVFKGWFAVPEYGIQSDIDEAVFKAFPKLDNKNSEQQFQNNPKLREIFLGLLNFYHEKQNILNNFTSLEKLESDYQRLTSDVPKINDENIKSLQLLLCKHNINKFPKIKNSPYRNLILR